MLPAEGGHPPDAGDSEPNLAGARLVVEARVEDATIVGGLVAGNLCFLLQYRDRSRWFAAQELSAVAKPTIPPPTTVNLRARPKLSREHAKASESDEDRTI